MAVDTNIILAATPANMYKSYSQGQLSREQLAQEQQATQQAQLATQQKQMATNQAQLEQQFIKWDNEHQLEQDPTTGEINVQKYLEAANAAGFGAFGRQAVQQLQQAKSGMAGGASGQQSQIQKILIDAANGMQGMSQSERTKAKDAARQNILRQFKVDINQMIGPNWDIMMTGAQYTPQAFQTKETQYATPEGRDPNSQTSVSLRNQLNSMGASVPANISAFEIYNNPMYQTLVDQISAGTRVQAVGNIAASEQQKQSISNLITRINTLQGTPLWRPAEKIQNLISQFVNTPQAAQLTQIVTELQKLGIPVDQNTNLAGALDSLQSTLGSIEQGQAGQKAIAGAKTITGALEAEPIKNVAPQAQQIPKTTTGKMTTIINRVTGKIHSVDAEQLAYIKSHKGNDLWIIK